MKTQFFSRLVFLAVIVVFSACENKPKEDADYNINTKEQKTQGGLRYIHHRQNKKGRLPLLGDYLTLDFRLFNEDRTDTFMNTYNETVPTEIQLLKPPFPGAIEEVLALVKEGDSITAFLPLEVIERNTMLPKMKKKTPIMVYDIKVKKIETPEEFQAKSQKRQMKVFEEQKEIIRKHVEEKQLGLKEHPSGIFYKHDLENTSPDAYIAKPGDSIVFDYVSLYFGGSVVFDRTDDPKDPKKSNPVGVVLGQKRLIPAWEIAFTQIMKEYEQVYMTVPAALAFGEKGKQAIPANAICEFLIRIKKIYRAEDLEKMRKQKK
jgi:FKBP-type peptidyl-prolyl cis-trans isomerase